MKGRVIATLVMTLCLTASVTSAQSIGVFFDPGGTICSAMQPPVYTPGTAYVLAILGGAAVDGIVSAGFRLEGMPEGWFANGVGPPGSVIGNDPLGAGGTIAWVGQYCNTPGIGGAILLFTITYFPTSMVPETYLRISGDQGYAFNCPWVAVNPLPPSYCSQWPAFQDFCVVGGQAILNGSPCTVAVEQNNWTGVKSLYRD